MELKDFVKDTLIQIACGVKDANMKYKEMGCAVNPRGEFKIEGVPCIKKETGVIHTSCPVTPVHFKVHIQVEESSAIKGGAEGGILKVVSASVDSNVSISNVYVQEIEFSVPVILPSEHVK